MAQPIWQSRAGSLGVVPEGIFFEVKLLATLPVIPTPVICTATTAGTNLITCDSTEPMVEGKVILFIGVPFGGLKVNTTYMIYSIESATQFQIKDHPDSTSPVTLSTATGVLTGLLTECVYYKLQAGTTPEGIQLDVTGTCYGVPQPVTAVRGIPVEVGEDVTSKFTVRAYTKTELGEVDRFIDRTFTLTITGNDPPLWVTQAGSIGSYYDADRVEIQLEYSDPDPEASAAVRLVAGALPLGLKVSETGRIYGYIRPFPDEDQPVGYDLQPYMTAPYDFVSAAISKNYQFTLEVFDSGSADQRTFTIYVYNREELTADYTVITADDDFVTADETTVRSPFLINAEPSDLGVARGDNNFAYRFIGEDYDSGFIEYKFSINQGFGTPPGLQLDPYSGWYYGNIPDVGASELTYSFNIQVRERSLVIFATESGTNIISCDSSTRGDFYVGSAITFEGDVIGGLAEDTTYYVRQIISDTEFTISYTISGSEVPLTTAVATEVLLCVPEFSPRSQLYPFTLTIVGTVDRDVTWLVDSDLGDVENGSISLLEVAAESRGGTLLLYQLKSGAYNNLPQGLTLLPDGDIVGRVSFETFSLDLGATGIDASESNLLRSDATTFDSRHTFTINAYAIEDEVSLYEVNSVRVIDGGTGFSSTPTITFNEPTGATAIQATANVTVNGSAITAVTVTDMGADYTDTATYTLTGPGTGANLQVLMQQTGFRRIISVFKTFTVRVVRVYNKPYQNLTIMAMPPQNDRALLQELLTDTEIFVPDFIFRSDDPNFGLSTRVTYQHAFGLAPDTLDTYVESLNLNHYRKNLVLGQVETAQALDDDGNVIYEVVYSHIIDNLINAQGKSVSRIITTPYAINNPEPPPELINSVYPNSLVNMRDQVIDVVGQLSTKLPLWMTSKQPNGQVLGFVPAWVICYTKPERSKQIAYYLSEYFGEQLNKVDFQVDRYILDTTLSINWDPATQQWSPSPEQTTFDRVNTTGYTDLGVVNACTELAFEEVNSRTLTEINVAGGLDGPTWIFLPDQSPPSGTKVTIRNGSKIIFVKQEDFDNYETDNDAFVNNQGLFDDGAFDFGIGSGATGSIGNFDYGPILTGGYSSICTDTNAGTDLITAGSTINMQVNDKIWFTGIPFGNIDDKNSLTQTQVYFVQAIDSITGSTTNVITDQITVSSVADLNIDDEIWFAPSAILTITETSAEDYTVTVGDNSVLRVDMRFIPTNDIGTLTSGTVYYISTLEGTNKVTLSNTYGGSVMDPGTDSGEIVTLAGGPIGSLSPTTSNGLAIPYYVVNIVGSQIEVSESAGGPTVPLQTDSGAFIIYRSAFSVALTQNAEDPLELSTESGSMTVNYENRRMAIYTISINGDLIQLTLDQETVADDYVTSSQGQKYTNGTYLYRPQSPEQGLSRVNWQPLINVITTISDETIFDMGSVQWVEPVDMYDPSDQNDKYLVFPKVDILQ